MIKNKLASLQTASETQYRGEEMLHNSFSYPPLHLHNVYCVAQRRLISSQDYFSDGGFLMKKQYNYH